MELPLQPLKQITSCNNLSVSILVLMELPLQRVIFSIPNIELEVSILVLMELPLQHLVPFLHPHNILCFNPCFNGTTSATTGYFQYQKLNLKFQSLF